MAPTKRGNIIRRKKEVPPETITFRWNEHFSAISSTFYQLFKEERYVDVSLACEGQTINCHRVILSACSSVFDSILLSNPDKMVIYVAAMKFWELKELVEFMYKGELTISKDLASAFIQAGHDLNIKGLMGLNPYDLRYQRTTPPSPSFTTLNPLDMPMPKLLKFDHNSSLDPTPCNSQSVAGSQLSSYDNYSYSPVPMPVPLNLVKSEVDEEMAEPGGSQNQVVNPLFTENGNRNHTVTLAKIKTENVDGTETTGFNDQEFVLDPDPGRSKPLEDCESAIKKETCTSEPEKESQSSLTQTQSSLKQSQTTQDSEYDGTKAALDKANESVEFNQCWYQSMGQMEGSTPMKLRSRRMKYPVNVKAAAVQDLLNGIPLGDCAEKYYVPKKTLSNWKSKHLKTLISSGGSINTGEVKRARRRATKASLTPTETPQKTRAKRPVFSVPTLGLPPIEGKTRKEHLQHAARLVVDKMTNIRGAANHYGIPRTTLSNYMARNGLRGLRKFDEESLSPDEDTLETTDGVISDEENEDSHQDADNPRDYLPSRTPVVELRDDDEENEDVRQDKNNEENQKINGEEVYPVIGVGKNTDTEEVSDEEKNDL